MAVYTDVSADELLPFLAAYDVGAPRAFKGIAEGVENSNFLLETERGRFILTLYEKRVSAADLPFFLGLLDHLAARGLPVPTPIHGRDGQALRRLNGRPAAIVRFLDGLSLRKPEPKHCAEAGAALARLHVAASEYAPSRANALGPAGWPALAQATAARADSVAPGLAALIADELAALQTAWPRALPQGVIHADLFPDNVLFVGDALSGLIDFYFACTDALAYDVAVCLNAWCFEPDGAFNVTKARALLRGYAAVRPLAPEEVAALPLLARGSALRFLLTRLYDWLHRDPNALVRPKDPLEYAKKLAFHRQSGGPAAYGLP